MVDSTLPRRPVDWDRLRADEAERIVRARTSTSANVIIGDHAFDRIAERTIIVTDVYRILRNGYVEGNPVRNPEGDWEIVMTKRLSGAREAGAAMVICRTDETIFVKTVMWMDTTR